jgi:hypothetical protein
VTSQSEDPRIPVPKRKKAAQVPQKDRVPVSVSDDDSEPTNLMDIEDQKFVQVLAVDLEGRGKVVRVTARYTGINVLGDLGFPESTRLQMDARELVKDKVLAKEHVYLS